MLIMQAVATRYQSQLARIKANVEKSYLYFKPNYDRFNGFRKQIFNTMLDSETIALLKNLRKPQIEFNILEAYISRLRGEFAKQEPSFEVMAGDEGPVDVEVIETVHGHLKHILCEANKDGFEYEIYTDTLSGGFSVVKVFTEYAHEMSFNQNIKIARVYDPTLCGFDPLARLSHKGDGNYAFELYPKLREDFEREYPSIDIEKLTFTKALEGFNWSFKNEKDEILILADYYEKKKRKERIVQLANRKVMTVEEYDKFVAEWEQAGITEQAPAVIGKSRKTEIVTIDRYKLIDTEILEHKSTNFKMLPLIFIDGNSIVIRHPNDGSAEQMTRPYVFHAIGIQKLKNFAGQTLANELENMIQHKFKVAKEALPLEEDYLQAYRDVQQADVLVYNYNNELRPDQPLPAPEVVQRIPIPPEVTQTFQGADQLTQTILGNFDMDLGRLNKSQVSGIAVQESITQSNSAAMPYIVGYLQGLNRIADMAVDLIPKYWQTPRTMPVVGLDGKRGYRRVNEPQGVNLKYDSNALNVKVEAGVNWSVQKAKALTMITTLMQSSELFSQFMNTVGLDILLDNIEIKGVDHIKEMAHGWMQEMQKARQQQMQQQQQQGNPMMMQAMLEKMKIEQKAEQSQIDARLKTAELAIAKQKADTEQLAALAAIGADRDKTLIAHDKAQAERARAAVDLAIKELDVRKHHDHNAVKLHHEMTKGATR
jgi:hypothetical protein